MDWKSIVGPLLQSSAPALARVLLGEIPIVGPFVSGIGADAVGALIASQFGVAATPQAVSDAIQNSPSDLASQKLQNAQQEAIAKWPALAQIAQAEAGDRTAQSQAINATMTAEVAKGQPWYAWRNIWGYSVATECAGVGTIILYSLATGDAKAVNLFLSASNFFLTWYGMRVGVLGYIFRGTSNEKIAAVTGDTPGMVGSIVKAIRGK